MRFGLLLSSKKERNRDSSPRLLQNRRKKTACLEKHAVRKEDSFLRTGKMPVLLLITPERISGRGISRSVCAGFHRGSFCAGADSSAWLRRIRRHRCIPARGRGGGAAARRGGGRGRRRGSAGW